jgi:hypothetical protein
VIAPVKVGKRDLRFFDRNKEKIFVSNGWRNPCMLTVFFRSPRNDIRKFNFKNIAV